MSEIKNDDDPTPAKPRAHYKFGDLQQSKPYTSRPSNNPPSRGRAAHNPTGNQHHRTLTLRDQKERPEECRLLGSSFASSRSDPNAVAIPSPGSAMRTKVGETFQPRDTLNIDRESPRAALNDHNGINSSKTSLTHLPLPESAVEKIRRTPFHDKIDERPTKKQKVATPACSICDAIEIEDDDDTKSRQRAETSQLKPVSPVGHKLRRASPSGPQKSRAQKSSSLPEFWDVEGTVNPRPAQSKRKHDRAGRQGDRDELNNKEVSAGPTGKVTREDFEKRTSQVMAAVEIPATPNKTKSEEEVGNSSNLRAQSARSDSQHRDIDTRESPDELQGAKTVSDSWKLRANAEKRTSPSNIPPTQFLPGSAKRSKRRGQSGDHTNKKRQLTCQLDLFRHDRTITQQPLELTADVERGTFSVKAPNHLIDNEQFDLSRVNSVLHSADDGDTKMRFQFPKSQGSSQNTVDVQFTDVYQARHFCSIVRKVPNVKVYDKAKNWMNKAFEKRGLTSADTDETTGPNRQNESRPHGANPVTPQSPKHKRQKLSESLQNGSGLSHVGQVQHSGFRNSPTRPNTSKSDRSSDLPSHAHPSPEKRESGGTTIPVKAFQGTYLTKRETRSQTKQQQNFAIDSDEERSPTSVPSVIRNTRWDKPLVYPKTGKKKAEVEAHDLERLRDSEFLNDNLIGFYIRFLEYHLERTRPDLAKRMYFFNSYFFDSLTNTPRGVRGINYQAVQKWTRAVDIFSYDYIVVPINESAHWYIAIICNLPSLIDLVSDGANSHEDTRKDADPPKEPLGDQESSPPRSAAVKEDDEVVGNNPLEPQAENSKDDYLPQSFRSMSLSGQHPAPSMRRKDDEPPTVPQERECSNKEDWPDEDENQPSAVPTPCRPNQEEATAEGRHSQSDGAAKSGKASSSKKKRHQKPRPPVQKFDPKQPIIITFDSLGCTRSLTSRALREYLEEEGKSKRSITFDGKTIKSMTAKQIPLQPNFSDCGLYLLAYLEKFILDPDTFATKLLRKEMNEHTDWPRLRSGELRRRLLKFLLDLYEEQNGDKGKEHGGAPYIVDTRPLHILLRDEEPATDRHQIPKPAPLDDHQSSESHSRPAAPKQTDRQIREETDHAEQPSTPVRSSPRSNHAESLENDRPTSPVDSIEQLEPEKHIKQEGTELVGQLEAMIQQGQESLPQPDESYVPETPPPDDGNVADGAVSQDFSDSGQVDTK